jgi:hypothetical protein
MKHFVIGIIVWLLIVAVAVGQGLQPAANPQPAGPLQPQNINLQGSTVCLQNCRPVKLQGQ